MKTIKTTVVVALIWHGAALLAFVLTLALWPSRALTCAVTLGIGWMAGRAWSRSR
jgi:hypothetical protein